MKPHITIAALLLWGAALCDGQIPGCTQLQSDFLKNDPTAQAIVTGGLANYSIDDFSLRLGDSMGGTSVFAYRLLSAIRQLGYLPPVLNTTEGEDPGLELLNKFQSANGLPQSSTITPSTLLAIDAALTRREMLDSTAGHSFPLLPLLPEAPPNEPPATHAAAVMEAVFAALPPALRAWNLDNFRLYAETQGGGTVRTTDGERFCSGIYYAPYGNSCDTADRVSVLKDDFTAAATFLHEYAHYLDKNLYGPPSSPNLSMGVIDTTAFYSISYDLGDSRLIGGFNHYRLLRGPSSRPAEFISAYAVGWGEDSYSTPYEDFAESLTAYVMAGGVFRQVVGPNPYLRQKYDWLKQNVFQGLEYNTGSLAGLAFLEANPRSADRVPAFNVVDYVLADPDAVWDFDPGLYQPPSSQPQISGVADAAGRERGAVVPGELVIISGSGLSIGEHASVDSPVRLRLGGTRVLFDGAAAPVLYAAPDFVLADVPYATAYKNSVSIQVELGGTLSAAFGAAVARVAPKLFATDAQALALNQDGSLNGPDRPAEPNSIVTLFATGAGPTCPSGVDGRISDGAPVAFTSAARVTLGGLEVDVVSASPASGLPSGIIQLQVRIPESLPGDGAVPVILTLGGASSQPGVNLTVGR